MRIQFEGFVLYRYVGIPSPASDLKSFKVSNPLRIVGIKIVVEGERRKELPFNVKYATSMQSTSLQVSAFHRLSCHHKKN
ncbi:MAG: hypothetical protein ACE5K0_05610 [Candidatus Methanofastidiosia archaeon]